MWIVKTLPSTQNNAQCCSNYISYSSFTFTDVVILYYIVTNVIYVYFNVASRTVNLVFFNLFQPVYLCCVTCHCLQDKLPLRTVTFFLILIIMDRIILRRTLYSKTQLNFRRKWE